MLLFEEKWTIFGRIGRGKLGLLDFVAGHAGIRSIGAGTRGSRGPVGLQKRGKNGVDRSGCGAARWNCAVEKPSFTAAAVTVCLVGHSAIPCGVGSAARAGTSGCVSVGGPGWVIV